MFLKRPKIVAWLKDKSLDIYFDQKENNHLKLDVDLFSSENSNVSSLTTFLAQNKIDTLEIVVPDDFAFTKSFLYDTKIDSIDKNEVIGLASSFVHLKINPDSIEYNLVQTDTKTIIQSRIFDSAKYKALQQNLSLAGLKNTTIIPASASIAKVFASFDQEPYFLLYPLNSQESTLILAKGDSVYLTANFKNSNLDLQKTINYSNLYFKTIVDKFYLPNLPLEIIATSQLNKSIYSDNEIALKFGKASNLPLPVLGCIINESKNNLPIPQTPSTPTMENHKKNLLPLVAVFVVTAAIASIVIWYVLSNSNNSLENPFAVQPTPTTAPTPTVMLEPTATPTPIITNVDKKIKIQVLNGTDINGQAASLKDRLTKLGFTSVAIGNAKETSTTNIIRIKTATDAPYFQSKLVGFLDEITVEELPASSTYDAVFVIGTKLGTAPAPTNEPVTSTVTPTKKVTPTIEE